MLGGTDSGTAREHAAELISSAANERPGAARSGRKKGAKTAR
jgi:hypothetical protein